MAEPPPPRLLDPLRAARDDGSITAEAAGAAYERHLDTFAGRVRRDSGVYFTPADLAAFVVERTLEPLLSAAPAVSDTLALRLCDPAAGAGAFLLPALDLLAADVATKSGGQLGLTAARRIVLEQCIYAVDADLITMALLRSILCARVGDAMLDLTAVEAHLCTGDAVCGMYPAPATRVGVNWARQFPEVVAAGGFTAVIGNPPWGAVKATGRHRGGPVAEWQEHRDHKRAYVRALRAAGYQYQGAGDTDLYRYFIERSHQMLRSGGRMGLIVPSAVGRTEGAAPLRRLLLTDGTAELMLDFVNTGRIFNIHGMFRFLVLVWQQGFANGVRRAAFGLRSVSEARSATGVRLDLGSLRRASGDRLSIPDVRDVSQVELFDRLHKRCPLLGASDSPWRVRFVREADMTNDASLFVPVAQAAAQDAVKGPDGVWHHPRRGPLLPLYEGRMVHQFDAAAKGYVSGTGRSAVWEPLLPGSKCVRPQYLVAPEAIGDRVHRQARAAFCDITGHANERTVLAALVPADSVCGNKVPTCRFETDDPRTHLLWLALVNSFVVDWLVRRRISTSLNYFLWAQVPLPWVDPDSHIGAELVSIAAALSEPAAPRWPTLAWAERADLRVRADVLVARAYGLDVSDMALVLSDFPLLDRHVGVLNHPSTVTRDSVLLAMAAGEGNKDFRLTDVGINPSGGADLVAERVAAAEERREVAYVPGEVAAYARRSSAPRATASFS
jgi:hypothetical protein